MKIVFLAPTHRSKARGNRVTVDRWAQGLAAQGHRVRVVENHQRGLISDISPDILHAHHAVHCGPTGVRIAASLPATASVVSLGGTDLHAGDAGLAPEAQFSLHGADAVVGPFAEDGIKLQSLLPDSSRFHVVPRGVRLSTSARPPRLETPLHGVLLGGIRPVKGQLSALEWQRALRQSGVPVRLSFAGPLIDESYGRKLVAACQANNGADWLGALEQAAATALIEDADFLLNSSHSEGASNAILEALASGRPVCARRAPGNTEMLSQAPSACVHLVDDDEAGMVALAGWLEDLAAGDAESLFELARDFVCRHHSTEAELDALIRVYQHVSRTS